MSVKVGVLGVSGYSLMSMAALVEPMRAANLIAGKTLFDVHYVGGSQSSAGFHQQNVVPLNDCNHQFDMICLIAGGDPFSIDDGLLLSWLRAQSSKSVTICGVSGGPVVLALAGLLGGYRTTVHWEHRAKFREQFKTPILVSGLYVIDRNRVTCAGGLASMDMIHALISREYGAEFARSVSDWFIHTDVRVPESRQRSTIFSTYEAHDKKVQQALSFIHDHLGDSVTLDDIAANAGLSDRQLMRRFSLDIGLSPMQVLKKMRLNVAREMLLNSSKRVTEIAYSLNFTCSSYFTARYRRAFGETPTQTRLKSKKRNAVISSVEHLKMN